MSTTRGYALNIGLNFVDPGHYGGWDGELAAAEYDAHDMASLLNAQGFDAVKAIRQEATRPAVIGKLKLLADTAVPGDIVVITYSGHGGQLPDLNGDEYDAMDETWCLYDGEIVDDELFQLYARFKKGVRVLVLSDSCHSGSVTRLAYGTKEDDRYEYKGAQQVEVQNSHVHKSLPADVARRTYHQNQAFYDPILKDEESAKAIDRVQASLLLISGCQDNQYSYDGTFNGLFTSNLLAVWNGGKFKGNHKQFRSQIVSRMPRQQTPNLYWACWRDQLFEGQTPFTI